MKRKCSDEKSISVAPRASQRARSSPSLRNCSAKPMTARKLSRLCTASTPISDAGTLIGADARGRHPEGMRDAPQDEQDPGRRDDRIAEDELPMLDAPAGERCEGDQRPADRAADDRRPELALATCHARCSG